MSLYGETGAGKRFWTQRLCFRVVQLILAFVALTHKATMHELMLALGLVNVVHAARYGGTQDG